MTARALSVRVLLAVAVVAVGALGACNSDDDPTVADPSNGDPPSTTASTPSSSTTAPAGFSVDAQAREGTGRALLTAIRHAAHEGYYRITFEFEDARPGYRVAYTDEPVTEDASGEEVELAGAAALLVRFEPASGVDLQSDQAIETYKGPRRLEIETGPVVEMARVGDFEAVLTWAVGLSRERPFRVTTLDAPFRVVVDIQT